MKRIEKELTGESLQVGAYRLRPVAHLRGRLGAPKRSSDNLAWGYARLEPVALIVDSPDDTVRRIAIAGSDGRVARGLLGAGLLIAIVSAAVIVARRLAR